MLIRMLEWASWGAVLLWAIASVGRMRRNMARGSFPSPPYRLGSLGLWALLVVFLFVHWSKFHMLWLAPSTMLVLRFGSITVPWPFYPLMPITTAYASVLAFDIKPPAMTALDALASELQRQVPTVRYLQVAFLPAKDGSGLGVSFLATDNVPLKDAVQVAKAQMCTLLLMLPSSLARDVARVLFTATAAEEPASEATVVLRAEINSSQCGRVLTLDDLRQRSMQYKEYV